jgi:hypothetical protein
MQKGELVFISLDAVRSTTEQAILRYHGYLWGFVKAVDPDGPMGPMGLYVSLATGRRYCWFDTEVERADAEQEA